MPSIDGVDAFFLRLFLQLLHQSLGNTVHTTNGRNNPYFITHAHVAILSDIALKAAVFFFNAKFFIHRTICVLERT